MKNFILLSLVLFGVSVEAGPSLVGVQCSTCVLLSGPPQTIAGFLTIAPTLDVDGSPGLQVFSFITPPGDFTALYGQGEGAGAGGKFETNDGLGLGAAVYAVGNGSTAALRTNQGQPGATLFCENTNRSLIIQSAISASTATTAIGAFRFKPTAALDATDLVFDVQNSVAAHLFSVNQSGLTAPVSTAPTAASGSIAFQQLTGSKHCLVTGGTGCSSSILGVGMPQTDQSADCDNAATGNAPTGKVCVGLGQGSMVLTNSSISSTSLVFLTNISDDTTCLSGYVTVGAGSATIGCVGAATATANTVFAFAVFNP